MDFITGKHLSRRTFLHGTGASLALPFLDAMVPAGRVWRDPAQGFTRLICLEEDLGHAAGNAWGDAQYLFGPEKLGRGFELVERSSLKQLEKYREYLTIVSNTDCRMGEPFKAEEIAAHSKETSLFLTQAHALHKSGEVYLGKSIDQVHADRFGQDTPLPSLELTTGTDSPGGGCEYGYHCAYSTALSWASPTQPLPGMSEPRAVFEQLFGSGDSPADRASRLRTNQSVLDYVATNLARLKRELGATDRRALDGFTTDIRELERRISLVEAHNSSGEERALPEAPSGIPDSWAEHVELMFDLQVLALQADITRVSTLKFTGRTNANFPDSGVSKDWHNASHHGNLPQNILDFNAINAWRVGRMTHLLEKMKNTMEAGASLLDRSVVVWGSAMGDPNLHNHLKCPLLLMGHGNGALEGNLHLRAPDSMPMANAFLSLLHGIGHDDIHSFGNATGEFPLTFPRGGSVVSVEEGA